MRRLPRLLLIGTAVAVLATGCAPAGPRPPMFGPGDMGLVSVVLVVVVGYFIWYKMSSINSRLEALEKEVERLKSKMKGEDHD